jgi:hypothetical protein
MKNEKSTNINTRYPQDIYDAMNRLADRHRRSFNAEVMMALEQYIEQQGTGDYELRSYVAGYTTASHQPIIHWHIIEVLKRDQEGNPQSWRRNEDAPYYYDNKDLAEEALRFYNRQERKGNDMAGRPTKEMKLHDALENYLKSDDFKTGVIAATRASWGGSGYSVELLPDRTSRNLWNSQIGNRYESEGIILPLPTLDTDDMSEYVDGGAGSEDDFLAEAFENEREELAQLVRNTLADKQA